MNENAMSFQVGKTIKATKEAEFEYDLYLNQRGNILIRAVAKIILTMCLLCSVAQLCVTLCNPMRYCPPGSSVHGIFQARILE